MWSGIGPDLSPSHRGASCFHETDVESILWIRSSRPQQTPHIRQIMTILGGARRISKVFKENTVSHFHLKHTREVAFLCLRLHRVSKVSQYNVQRKHRNPISEKVGELMYVWLLRNRTYTLHSFPWPQRWSGEKSVFPTVDK